MALLCPTCGSDTVQKVSVIYEQQTHTGMSSGGGVGLALTPNGLAPVVGGTSGTQLNQSLLAQRLAPPRLSRPVPKWAWVVVVIGFIFYLIPGLLLLLFWIPRLRRGDPGAADAYAAWQRSYYCHRCGAVFDPEASPAPEPSA
jgi:hypothetical protein